MNKSNGEQADRVLFICTGNFYRSRYAEAFFNYTAKGRGLPLAAFSRGLNIDLVSGDISPIVMTAMIVRGMDPSLTTATRTPLSEGDLETANHRIAMQASEHRPMMQSLFPAWADRVEYWDVRDIPGQNPVTALMSIERSVLELIARLTDGGKDGEAGA